VSSLVVLAHKVGPLDARLNRAPNGLLFRGDERWNTVIAEGGDGA